MDGWNAGDATPVANLREIGLLAQGFAVDFSDTPRVFMNERAHARLQVIWERQRHWYWRAWFLLSGCVSDVRNAIRDRLDDWRGR